MTMGELDEAEKDVFLDGKLVSLASEVVTSDVHGHDGGPIKEDSDAPMEDHWPPLRRTVSAPAALDMPNLLKIG